MYRLPEIKWKRPIAWKQLVPRCSHPECTTGTSWTGVLHRASGFWFNEQQWFCSPRCLEESLEDHLLGYFFDDRRPAPIRTTMPMGLMMLSRGVISDPQLRDAIELQRSSGEKIGACLQRLGFISLKILPPSWPRSGDARSFPPTACSPAAPCWCPAASSNVIAWCPCIWSARAAASSSASATRSTTPLSSPSSRCSAATPKPASFPSPSFSRYFEYRKRDTNGEVAVSRPDSAAETARMILSYAQQTGADAIRLRAVEGNIWVRFLSRRSHLDLVFELLSR